MRARARTAQLGVQYVPTAFRYLEGPEGDFFPVSSEVSFSWEFEGFGRVFCFVDGRLETNAGERTCAPPLTLTVPDTKNHTLKIVMEVCGAWAAGSSCARMRCVAAAHMQRQNGPAASCCCTPLQDACGNPNITVTAAFGTWGYNVTKVPNGTLGGGGAALADASAGGQLYDIAPSGKAASTIRAKKAATTASAAGALAVGGAHGRLALAAAAAAAVTAAQLLV